MTRKPWDGVIPPEDVQSFRGGSERRDRPISAGSRPAVIVVDMTRAFVDSAYPWGFSPTGSPAVEANARLLATARPAGLPVFFTNGYANEGHQPLPIERGRWKHFGGAPVVPEGLPPADVIVDALAPQDGEIVIHKAGKPSGFFGTPLASYLVHAGCDTVVVTGMTTSGCVRATVLDAFQYNFHCIVPVECVADRSQISHKVSLFDLHMKYADVVSLEETVEYIEKVVAG